MTAAELTGVVMGATAIVTVIFLVFSTRGTTARLTAGTDGQSWGVLVSNLQTEIERAHRECNEEIERVRRSYDRELAAARTDLHEADLRIEELRRLVLNGRPEARRARRALGQKPPDADG
jgi:hypothetical protein